ncbi:MAG: FAD:protein FMN transferase [Planctomycetaceae bacterium]|nr:FAD:protein FMN transferase [Planctomycetaceae bacterium]
MATEPTGSSRRDFLTGRAAQAEAAAALRETGDALIDSMPEDAGAVPSAGATVRLQTRAMNCEFAVILNPGAPDELAAASRALDLVHPLESQLTVYRSDSEMSRLNQRAASSPVTVEPQLFDLLVGARQLSQETQGAFDPTSGPLIALWNECRRAGRLPTSEEVDAARQRTGMAHVDFDVDQRTVRFDREGIELNLGAIGKGYALDRIAARLVSGSTSDDVARAPGNDWGAETDTIVDPPVLSFLLHGGHSSLIARGDHKRTGGWPVGLRNPAVPTENMATLLLRDVAMATSGAGEQFSRIGGMRYGHILDPRTGWPADEVLSVTVLAPTAAEADALSTAFFVGGVEIARRYCDNRREVAALLTPQLRSGRTVELWTLNIGDGMVFVAPGCQVTRLDRTT